MSPTILVTGGAGYIGAHVVRALTEQGYAVVVLDDLSHGCAAAVPGVTLYQASLTERAVLRTLFATHDVDAVIHLAGESRVADSVADPELYWRRNVVGTLDLLTEMAVAKVQKLVFSSTCSVFGIPRELPLVEDHPLAPTSPYGSTKLAIENLLRDFGNAHGLRSVALRFFNAAGAHPSGELGESHTPETHLIPLAMEVALQRRHPLQIFGTNYDTPDGTCIRDYVHVCDLADAHLLSLRYLDQGGADTILNLGSDVGYSVLDVIHMCRQVTGRDIPFVQADRRPGDPPCLVASSRLARATLGWSPTLSTLRTIIETAWRWHQAPRY